MKISLSEMDSSMASVSVMVSSLTSLLFLPSWIGIQKGVKAWLREANPSKMPPIPPLTILPALSSRVGAAVVVVVVCSVVVVDFVVDGVVEVVVELVVVDVVVVLVVVDEVVLELVADFTIIFSVVVPISESS